MDKKRKVGHPKKSGNLYMLGIRCRNEQQFNFILKWLTPEQRYQALINAITADATPNTEDAPK